MVDHHVDRPNREGTLSGHAAGEPFEKNVYYMLKAMYPDNIFKQYEYLNDIYLRHPQHITVKQRYDLLESPTALFLLTRGRQATKEWSPENVFVEKQNDTADIIYYEDGFYNIIDVKTRNSSKDAQPPNIISSYKLAKMCAIMIDNQEFENIDIDYIEVDWIEDGNTLKCINAHHGNLFKADPDRLYINWASGLQIQFHVCKLDQSWKGTRESWARNYLRMFVNSAEQQCHKMHETYVIPFLKYIRQDEPMHNLFIQN